MFNLLAKGEEQGEGPSKYQNAAVLGFISITYFRVKEKSGQEYESRQPLLIKQVVEVIKQANESSTNFQS